MCLFLVSLVTVLRPAHFLSVDLASFKGKINFCSKMKNGLLNYANFYGLI